MNVGGTISYLASDGLGSVSEALSTSGTVTAAQLYGPYGGVRYSSGTMPTAKGFTGQQADAVSGLDYYGARYYDPVLGQFASADTKQGPNRFAYVADDPETLTDPTGQLRTCMDPPCGGGGGGGGGGSCHSDGSCGCYTSCGGSGGGGGSGNPPPGKKKDPPPPPCDNVCKAQQTAEKAADAFAEISGGLWVMDALLGALIGGLTAAIAAGQFWLVPMLLDAVSLATGAGILAAEANWLSADFTSEKDAISRGDTSLNTYDLFSTAIDATLAATAGLAARIGAFLLSIPVGLTQAFGIGTMIASAVGMLGFGALAGEADRQIAIDLSALWGPQPLDYVPGDSHRS